MSPNIPKFPTNSCERPGLLNGLVSKNLRVKDRILGEGIMSSYLSSLSRDTRLLNKSLELVVCNGAIRGGQDSPVGFELFGGARQEQINLFSVSSRFPFGMLNVTYPSGWSGTKAPEAPAACVPTQFAAVFMIIVPEDRFLEPDRVSEFSLSPLEDVLAIVMSSASLRTVA